MTLAQYTPAEARALESHYITCREAKTPPAQVIDRQERVAIRRRKIYAILKRKPSKRTEVSKRFPGVSEAAIANDLTRLKKSGLVDFSMDGPYAIWRAI